MKTIRSFIFWILALGFWLNPFHLGAQGTPHFNTITWMPSSTSGVTSQKIYRSITSGGPYTLLATIPNGTVVTFQDNDVMLGVKHFYVLTASVGATESVFTSPEVNTTDKGTNVNPQTGVAVTSQ